MSSNQFQVFNDNNTDNVVNKQFDINKLIPELTEYTAAMERGESWYDIMYPRNQDITASSSNGWSEVGKKRKRDFVADNTVIHNNKKKRYS
jgi:hypothetical protein